MRKGFAAILSLIGLPLMFSVPGEASPTTYALIAGGGVLLEAAAATIAGAWQK